MNLLEVVYIENNSYTLTNLSSTNSINVVINKLDTTTYSNFSLKETIILSSSQKLTYTFEEDGLYQIIYSGTSVNYIITTFADSNFKQCLNLITTKVICEDNIRCDDITNFNSLSFTSEFLYNLLGDNIIKNTVTTTTAPNVFYTAIEPVFYDISIAEKLIKKLNHYCAVLKNDNCNSC